MESNVVYKSFRRSTTCPKKEAKKHFDLILVLRHTGKNTGKQIVLKRWSNSNFFVLLKLSFPRFPGKSNFHKSESRCWQFLRESDNDSHLRTLHHLHLYLHRCTLWRQGCESHNIREIDRHGIESFCLHLFPLCQLFRHWSVNQTEIQEKFCSNFSLWKPLLPLLFWSLVFPQPHFGSIWWSSSSVFFFSSHSCSVFSLTRFSRLLAYCSMIAIMLSKMLGFLKLQCVSQPCIWNSAPRIAKNCGRST